MSVAGHRAVQGCLFWGRVCLKRRIMTTRGVLHSARCSVIALDVARTCFGRVNHGLPLAPRRSTRKTYRHQHREERIPVKMKLPSIAAVLSLLLASHLFAQSAVPDWVRVTDKTAFTPRDSCGELVYKDRMWILGGWMDSFQNPPRDVWSSADGKEWTRVTDAAAWKHADFPMTLVFKDRMWVMGGWHGGRLPHASASNAVWSSTDGADWKKETAAAGWSPRMAAGAAVFKDRMWILGGVQKYYYGDDDDLRNDVWSSADGVKWEAATAKAPWPARAYLQALVYNGKLWVLGGGNYVTRDPSLPASATPPKVVDKSFGYQAFNDVWSSPDGVNWTQETAAAQWPPRIWFSAAVYRDRMWVLGGWSNKAPGLTIGTTSGTPPFAEKRQEDRLKTETIWARRHEHSTYVFRDKLWVVGGHAAPLANDVWQLALPKDWPK